MTYYNDIETGRWLRGLVDADLIAPGDVDERSIADVQPDDLAGYGRCHFFAGIAGWEYALQLAGWPEDRPVWTGSCPCQPFSVAGKRKGTADERHLWPAFRALIAERRPATVFGEQVASDLGREWVAGVRADLEALGYAVGCADLCAAGVSAPHIRQRLYWVAYAQDVDGRPRVGTTQAGIRQDAERRGRLAVGSTNGRMGQDCPIRQKWQQPAGATTGAAERTRAAGGIPDTEGRLIQEPQAGNGRASSGRTCPWDDYELIPCGDGKVRRIKPGIAPLASRIPRRVELLRGYGNAIVPQVAAVFIRSFMEAT
uniref:Putative methyltransferase n=1 Tax=viral metagenome TaxID=1070528 RepID=A0A6M3LEB5_9ZZZZ